MKQRFSYQGESKAEFWSHSVGVWMRSQSELGGERIWIQVLSSPTEASTSWLLVPNRVPLHSAWYILWQSWKFFMFCFPLRNKTGKKHIFLAYRALLPRSDHLSFSCCSQFLAVNRSAQAVDEWPLICLCKV